MRPETRVSGDYQIGRVGFDNGGGLGMEPAVLYSSFGSNREMSGGEDLNGLNFHRSRVGGSRRVFRSFDRNSICLTSPHYLAPWPTSLHRLEYKVSCIREMRHDRWSVVVGLPFMKHLLFALCLCLSSKAEVLLVKDGQPTADIVIAAEPQRSVRLAAADLQTYLEKVSGAKLAIVTEPTQSLPAHVFVGRSSHAKAMGISSEGLRDGAYRSVARGNALVLIGDDTDFTPIEPWAKHNGEIVSGKTQNEWTALTGLIYGAPNILMYKTRMTFPGTTGLPTAQATTTKVPPFTVWGFDERGSFNAVNGFLQKLGVRWYMPGEIGEVIPSMKTVSVPEGDETVKPDLPLRRINFRFGVLKPDTALWAMRLGLRDPYGIQDAHGLDTMTRREEVFAAHPDWFALYGGKRHFDLRQNNQLCYSNEELFQETLKYVRAQFDHYKMDAVSVMPPDGYTSICQCEKCAGKDSPDRDNRGLLSDYVWGFVNRVAKEVRKTHPNRKVLGCAYGVYTLPPLKIDKLEPNVVVSIVGARVPRNNKPEQQAEYQKLRESWVKKTTNPVINFENCPFTDRGWYLPAFTTHSMGESTNAMKGISQGEDIWLTVRQDFDKVGVAFNHFLVYFTARMWWGGKNQDADALLREYCRLFYGPAEKDMLEFFNYSEVNWQEMEKDKDKVDKALALFASAQSKAPSGSLYAQRLALMDDFLKGLRNKSQQLGKLRGPVPVLRLVNEAPSKIVIDGKFDEEAWEKCALASTVKLRELQTGRAPVFGTTVKSTWLGNNLYFAFRCEDHPGEKLNIGTTKKDDAAIWYGDAIEILLETESHSYYQIAVSPSGAVVDLDRSAPHSAWFSWDSQAEVATQIGDGYWTAEIRIPVTQDENDPLHQVIGHRPTRSLPWHVNLCRQRIREGSQEHSAFSPTGTDNFHSVMKFATFFDGNHYEFDHGPPDDDFLESMRVAGDYARTGKRDKAFEAYVAAAEGKITDLQKSHALELAVNTARGLRKYDEATELASRIPIDAVRKTAQMQGLLDQAKAAEVIAQFGHEDIASWPFWKRGEGYLARGRAYSIAKAGKEAEADLLHAQEWVTDPRLLDSIHYLLGSNRETNLKDEASALAAYHQIVDEAKSLGTSDQFTAIQAIARILTQRSQFDEALATLHKVEIDKMRGVWRDSITLSIGDTQLAAGRKTEAIATYQSIVNDELSDTRLRKVATEKIKTASK